MNQIDWPTVLVSLGVSLVVALITFTLGLKSGKNQADRQKLQDLYKSLLVHFEDMRERLDSYPRRWEQYDKKDIGWDTHYLPPARKMRDSGDSVYINKDIFDEALELERDTLSFSYDLQRFYDDFFDAIVGCEELIKTQVEVTRENRGHKCYSIKTSSDRKDTTGTGLRLFYFLKPGFENSITDALNKGGYLTFNDDRNPYQHVLTITQGSFDDASTMGIKLVELAKSCDSYEPLIKKRSDLKARIDKLTKKLTRKAKEPISFWETFFGAFGDMFRP